MSPILSTFPDRPHIVLLIATVGRIGELDRLLSSLTAQTYANFTILLADQNGGGYLDDMLARHTNLPMTRIALPSQGVSVARNALLRLADGDVIAFPDDDCWYAPDTLERVVGSFSANSDCGALLGVWTASPDTPVPRYKAGAVGRTGLFWGGGACVQFYRREAVESLLFDPMLGPGTGLPYGCGEDTDYLLSAHVRTVVRRCPDVRVFHPAPGDGFPSPQKVASYAAGRMYLLKKHNFPAWFTIFNVVYPLCVLPIDVARGGERWGAYRWLMFKERLKNWL